MRALEVRLENGAGLWKAIPKEDLVFNRVSIKKPHEVLDYRNIMTTRRRENVSVAEVWKTDRTVPPGSATLGESHFLILSVASHSQLLNLCKRF